MRAYALVSRVDARIEERIWRLAPIDDDPGPAILVFAEYFTGNDQLDQIPKAVSS